MNRVLFIRQHPPGQSRRSIRYARTGADGEIGGIGEIGAARMHAIAEEVA